MSYSKAYEYNNPFPKSGTDEIYQNIITRVMKGMEENLRSRGFDYEQIQMFTELWKNKLNDLQANDDTEENMYDNQDQHQYQTDLYSQHMDVLNGYGHPLSVNNQYKMASQQDEYSSSFVQKQDRRMNDSLSYNIAMGGTNPMDRLNNSNTIAVLNNLNNLTEHLDEYNQFDGENNEGDSISDVSDDDDEEEEKESDSRLVCLFNSVKHLQGKHRCEFTHCILKNGKKEYFFGKCLAEIESA